MLDTVFGLPTHVLVVHAAVVLLPVAALASLLLVLRPSLPRPVGLGVIALDALALATAWAARLTGQKFFLRLGRPEVVIEHAGRGSTMVWFVLALLVVTTAYVAARGRGKLTALVAVAVVAVALATGVWAVRTGHSGSAAVWGGVVQNTTSP